MRKKKDEKAPALHRLGASPEFVEAVFDTAAEHLGVAVGDVPVAARLLESHIAANALAAIPPMHADDPRPFIAAVAALVGQGVLSPDKAKVMLYACQLQVAVTRGLQPAPEAPRRVVHGLQASHSDAAMSLFTPQSPNGFDDGGKP